ncbi:MAG: MBL fold metallo-hydrolase [Candidatus Bathyarchaeia archaeon]|nr:MBL fold metallo-hydrolase [Candidatus Bathyarchaeota archaeon]
MKIRFLGACNEVGRSAIAVYDGIKYVLFDYGVIMNHEIGFPMHIPTRELDAIILSHAHLDHSGLIPLFYLSESLPLYGVEPTFQLTNVLIKDFLHLSGYYLPYEYIDLQNMLGKRISIKFNERVHIGNAEFTLINAGHIPGSCQVLMEFNGKKLLYTGDFNTIPTRLLNPAEQIYKDLDAIIIESTYADEEHPNRVKLEEEFVKKTREIIHDGGTVLVPAFGVGRSQEILMILTAYKFEYPIFIDGMAIEVTKIFMDYHESLRNPKLFEESVKKVEWIKSWKARRKAVKTPSIIISPAGMLKGGAAAFYSEVLAKSDKNAIFLVSYQVPGSPGRLLLEKRKLPIKGKLRRVEAQVEKFDFSSHVGKKELQEILSKLDSKTKVFVIHGAEGNCTKLALWASKELGLNAIAPNPGEVYEV